VCHPGYFAPIDIGGVEYVDGGVHSATNADVLRTERLDVALVVARCRPAGPGGAPPTDRCVGDARRSTARPVPSSRGDMVVRFEPGPETLHAWVCG